MFTTGETSFISDAIYNRVEKLCISPNLEDPEALLNGIMCQANHIGEDIAQVEYMERYAVETIKKTMNGGIVEYLNKRDIKTLMGAIN